MEGEGPYGTQDVERGRREREGLADFCLEAVGRCDGRYLLSAWSSQMVYLSKASRPGLGPP